jgi:hypothetical protein
MPKPDENVNAQVDNENDENANVNNNDANTNDNGASDNAQSNVEYVTLDAFNEMQSTLNSYKDMMNEIMGAVKSIKDAQGVMVRAGMVIQDDSDPEPMDDFKPLSELDFSVKR